MSAYIYMSNTISKNKRIAKNTLLLYFRMFFMMAVNLYTSRVVLEVLGVDDFGIYNIVGGVIVLFSFFNNALLSSTQRFLNYEIGQNNINSQKNIFKTSLLLYLLFILIIIVLAETIGLWFLNTQLTIPADRIMAANWVYQFSLVAFIINVIKIPYNATVIAYERMSFYAYLSIVEVILKLLIAYLLLITASDKLIVYAALTAVVTAIIWYVYRYYCLKQFSICHFRFYYNREIINKMLGFSVWSLWGSIANLSVNQGINILLNIFYGVTVNTSVGISNQIRSAINNFLVNFQIAFNPQIVKSYANHEIDRFHTLVIYSSKFSFFLIYLICVPFCLNASFVIQKWLGVLPDYVSEFAIGSLFILMVDAISAPLGFAIQATGSIKKYQIIYSFLSFIQLPMAYLLLQCGLSPIWIFASWCIVSLVNYGWKCVFVTHRISMPLTLYVRKVLYPVTLTIFLSMLVLYLLPFELKSNQWMQFVLSTSIIVFIILLAISIVGLNSKEKAYIIQIVKSKISK